MSASDQGEGAPIVDPAVEPLAVEPPKSSSLRQRFLRHVVDKTDEGKDVSLNLKFRKNVSWSGECTMTPSELTA